MSQDYAVPVFILFFRYVLLTVTKQTLDIYSTFHSEKSTLDTIPVEQYQILQPSVYI